MRDYALTPDEAAVEETEYPYSADASATYKFSHKQGGEALIFVGKDGTVWVSSPDMRGTVAASTASGQDTAQEQTSKGIDSQYIQGGDLLYQAAMTLAYNNGLKFMPDAAVSDIAKLRRNSHMLSNALRHGTTRHLTPFSEKTNANDSVAAQWKTGDSQEAFEHNLELLANQELQNVAKVLEKKGQAITDLRYDADSDTIEKQTKNPDGTLSGWQRISEGDLESVVDRLDPGNSGVGKTTLSRALVIKSALEGHDVARYSAEHYPSERTLRGGMVPAERRDQLLRVLGSREVPGKIFYSRGEATGSERVQRTGVTQEETTAAEARLKSTAQGRAIYGNVLIVDNRAALDGMQGRPGQQRYHAEDWDIMRDAEGFHDPRDGTVVIFRDNVRVLEGETAAQALARVVVHERVGHHGFDALRESDSKFAEEWKKLAAAIPTEQMEELEARYTHLNGNRDALALEWFAHQVGNMEGRAQLEPGSVMQRMWQAMRDWVTRYYNPLGDPFKEMSQEVIDAHVRGLIRATQRSMAKGASGAHGLSASVGANPPNGHGTLLGSRTQFSIPSSPDNTESQNQAQGDSSLNTSRNVDSSIPIPYVQQHGQGTERRRDAQAALRALLARAEADAGTNARSDAAQRIRAESESLVSWARESGWLIEPAGFIGLIDTLEGFEGGAEHEVFGVPEKGRVLKLTRPPNFGARGVLPSYLKNIQWSNALFHDDIRIEGVIETEDGPAVVISQPYIEGRSPEPEDVQDWFEKQGYVPAGENAWRHPDTGAVIADAHKRNFIMTDANELVPIDLQVLNPGKDILEQERHEQQ